MNSFDDEGKANGERRVRTKSEGGGGKRRVDKRRGGEKRKERREERGERREERGERREERGERRGDSIKLACSVMQQRTALSNTIQWNNI